MTKLNKLERTRRKKGDYTIKKKGIHKNPTYYIISS